MFPIVLVETETVTTFDQNYISVSVESGWKSLRDLQFIL